MKIKDLIKAENILIVEKSPATIEEALTLCCSKLLELGKVTEEYSKAIIKSHHELGSYYVLAPKIALPHARPENGVIEGGLQLTIFKEGMDFENEDNGDVYLAITLAATDSESHIQTIVALSELLGEEAEVEALINSNSIPEVLSILSKY
jgi:PTS system ascorbate-specific IIA component